MHTNNHFLYRDFSLYKDCRSWWVIGKKWCTSLGGGERLFLRHFLACCSCAGRMYYRLSAVTRAIFLQRSALACKKSPLRRLPHKHNRGKWAEFDNLFPSRGEKWRRIVKNERHHRKQKVSILFTMALFIQKIGNFILEQKPWLDDSVLFW